MAVAASATGSSAGPAAPLWATSRTRPTPPSRRVTLPLQPPWLRRLCHQTSALQGPVRLPGGAEQAMMAELTGKPCMSGRCCRDARQFTSSGCSCDASLMAQASQRGVSNNAIRISACAPGLPLHFTHPACMTWLRSLLCACACSRPGHAGLALLREPVRRRCWHRRLLGYKRAADQQPGAQRDSSAMYLQSAAVLCFMPHTTHVQHSMTASVTVKCHLPLQSRRLDLRV
jgi:hypothetical protein